MRCALTAAQCSISNSLSIGRLQDKGRLNPRRQTLIANAAAGYVRDGDALILDSGSTTAQIVPFLKGARSGGDDQCAEHCLRAWGNDGVEVMVLGGSVRRNSYSLYGPAAEQQLRQYRFDKLFLGVDGFDLSAGITTPHPGEAPQSRDVRGGARDYRGGGCQQIRSQELCMIREADKSIG